MPDRVWIHCPRCPAQTVVRIYVGTYNKLHCFNCGWTWVEHPKTLESKVKVPKKIPFRKRLQRFFRWLWTKVRPPWSTTLMRPADLKSTRKNSKGRTMNRDEQERDWAYDTLIDKYQRLEIERDELRAACAAYREQFELIQDGTLPDGPAWADHELSARDHGRAFLAQHKRMKSMLQDVRKELEWRKERDNDDSCQSDHTLIEWIDAALQDTEE